MPRGGRSYFGVWPGVVVSADDPERRGRLRVRVDQVYGAEVETEKILDAQLPWAEVCEPVTGVGSGTWRRPSIGAGVWVSFWQGDYERPVVIGGWYSNTDLPSEVAYQGPNPATYVVKTPDGHLFEMRSVNGQKKIQFVSAGGHQIVLDDSEGPKIEVITPAGNRITIDDSNGQITIETTGDVQVSAGGTAKINAPAVELGSSGGAKKRLATEDFVLTTYAVHSHLYAPGPGGVIPTAPPLPVAVPGIDLTTVTVAD